VERCSKSAAIVSIAEKNADFVIKGSVAIQKALGRDTQFANKREFETLMGSDDALIL